MSHLQYVYAGTTSGNELAYVAVALCFILAASGWLLIAEPVKHVKNTHHKSRTKSKAKPAARKPAKRKSKKK